MSRVLEAIQHGRDAGGGVCRSSSRRTAGGRLLTGGKSSSGLRKACEKRPVGITDLEKTVSRIEYGLTERGEKEVTSTEIGRMVMDELKRLDEVAYVRFASVYRQFKDIAEFMEELKELLSRKEET